MTSSTIGRITVAAFLLAIIGCDSAPQDQYVAVPPTALEIHHPIEGAVFPPEIAPATFRWEDPASRSVQWTISFDFEDGAEGLEFLSNSQYWTPAAQDWEVIKKRSRERKVRVTIRGLNPHLQNSPLSVASVTFMTSDDEVGAPIFYREVNLPFREAVKDPAAHIRWRFGSIASSEQPPVVLEQLPACGNCHSFSADGSIMGMDVDYANDKGSYAICKELNPKYAPIRQDFGMLLLRMGRVEEAQRQFAMAGQIGH